MEPSTGIKPWQWVVTIIVIVVVLGLGGYLIFGHKNADNSGATGGIEESTGTQTNTATINRISMSNQFPGNIVYVSSVSFTNGGFVAIHKDNNGKPGAIIGTQYFDAGTRPGTINLTEKTVEGGTYYAMLHSDDGDKVFDATKDLPLNDAAGAVIMQTFKATVNLPEDKG